MKKRNLLSGFALAVLMTLGIASAAKADDYTGNCAGLPADVSGNVNITDQSCTISQSVHASGAIFINASGGFIAGAGANLNADAGMSLTGNSIVIGNVSAAGGDVFLTSNLGIITAGTVTSSGLVQISGDDTVTTSDVTATGSSVYISSTNGDVSTGKVTGNGNFLQLITPNGKITVNDTITGKNLTQIFYAKNDISLQGVNNADGDVRIFANLAGGGDPFKIGSSSLNGATFIKNNGTSSRAIYISNGGGSAGINYSGSNVLQVNNSAGPAGFIILDGGTTNNVTLSGTLSADGSGGHASGVIDIFAPQIIANNATLSASSPGQNVGVINLVTSQITDNSGLTLSINGNGPLPNFVDLSLFPPGSYSVSASADPTIPITFGSFNTSNQPLTISGAGAFTINANGNNNGVKILGYPLAIKPTTTTINNMGGGNSVGIAGSDGGSSLTTLTLNGAITIHANTTAAGPANLINLTGTTIPALTGNVSLDAAGTNGGDGSNITLGTNSGTIPLGGTGNNFKLNSNGSSSGGKGGTITLGGGSTTYSVNNANGITASAQGGNGDGGVIMLTGQSLTNASGANSIIAADGKGTANGGKISLTLSGSLTVSSATNAFALEANSGTTGNGGEIDVNANNVTLDGTKFSVAALTNGKGGTVNLTAAATLKLTAGNITADGAGQKDGGNISLTASTLTITGSGHSVTANAGTTQGIGGNINITSKSAVTIGTGSGAISIKALGQGTGTGGKVSVIGKPATVAAGSSLSVTGGSSNGAGGNITVTSNGTGTAGVVSVSGTLDVSGLGSGSGGNISLTGDTLSLNNGQFKANGGTTGNGGTISLKSTSASTGLVIGGTTLINALGGTTSGNGNSITLTSGNSLQLGSTVSLDVSANNASGQGGVVLLTAATPVTLSGPISANGGTSSGFGGAISAQGTQITVGGNLRANGTNGVIQLTDSGAGAVITVSSTGQLNANAVGSSTIGGTITLKNALSNGLTVINDGPISANFGNLQFNQSGQVVSIAGSAFGTEKQLVGIVTAAGSSISIKTASSTDLVLGNITSTSDVVINQTSVGNVVKDPVSQPVITVPHALTINTNGGNIGLNATTTGRLATKQMQIFDGGTGITSGSLFIGNTNSTAVQIGSMGPIQDGGGFDFASSGIVTVAKSVTASNGDLVINATDTSGHITFNTGVVISAPARNSTISIATSTTGRARATCSASDPLGCTPDFVTVNALVPAFVFFNGPQATNNILAQFDINNNPPGTVINDAVGSIAFDTNGGLGAITMKSSVIFNINQ